MIKYLKIPHEWTMDDIRILESSGNEFGNAMFEADITDEDFDKALVLKDEVKEDCRRAKFIKNKYKRHRYRDDILFHQLMINLLKRKQRKQKKTGCKSKEEREEMIAYPSPEKQWGDKEHMFKISRRESAREMAALVEGELLSAIESGPKDTSMSASFLRDESLQLESLASDTADAPLQRGRRFNGRNIDACLEESVSSDNTKKSDTSSSTVSASSNHEEGSRQREIVKCLSMKMVVEGIGRRRHRASSKSSDRAAITQMVSEQHGWQRSERDSVSSGVGDEALATSPRRTKEMRQSGNCRAPPDLSRGDTRERRSLSNRRSSDVPALRPTAEVANNKYRNAIAQASSQNLASEEHCCDSDGSSTRSRRETQREARDAGPRRGRSSSRLASEEGVSRNRARAEERFMWRRRSSNSSYTKRTKDSSINDTAEVDKGPGPKDNKLRQFGSKRSLSKRSLSMPNPALQKDAPTADELEYEDADMEAEQRKLRIRKEKLIKAMTPPRRGSSLESLKVFSANSNACAAPGKKSSSRSSSSSSVTRSISRSSSDRSQPAATPAA